MRAPAVSTDRALHNTANIARTISHLTRIISPSKSNPCALVLLRCPFCFGFGIFVVHTSSCSSRASRFGCRSDVCEARLCTFNASTHIQIYTDICACTFMRRTKTHERATHHLSPRCCAFLRIVFILPFCVLLCCCC